MFIEYYLIVVFICFGISGLFYFSQFEEYKRVLKKYDQSFIGLNYGWFEIHKIIKAYKLTSTKSIHDRKLLKEALMLLFFQILFFILWIIGILLIPIFL